MWKEPNPYPFPWRGRGEAHTDKTDYMDICFGKKTNIENQIDPHMVYV